LTETPHFADRLLAWWDVNGRHDLPWQHPRTPYRVWVSEIMLQQTQVAAVVPYFERFVQSFPGIPELATAPLDAVLSRWSGLGYYARARNLHRAARICQDAHDGELPATAEELAALPGIGQSTANAIVSQAHDVPAAVVDGNVRRVLARREAVEGWPGQGAVNREIWRIASGLLPRRRGADYTQAIMDLGATVCTRTRPRCGDCPVRTDCQAFQTGTVDRYPAPKPRTRVLEQSMYMLLLRRPGGEVLLERRPAAGIWGGLWCLPTAESREGLAARHGLIAENLDGLPELEHRLTHRLLRIKPLGAEFTDSGMPLKCTEQQRWLPESEWRQLGLPRPVTELLNLYLPGEHR
jgi:A/G-specific adenine glycosylase